jgi:hypothetical protein
MSALRFKMAIDIICTIVRYIRDGDIHQTRARSLSSSAKICRSSPKALLSPRDLKISRQWCSRIGKNSLEDVEKPLDLLDLLWGSKVKKNNNNLGKKIKSNHYVENRYDKDLCFSNCPALTDHLYSTNTIKKVVYLTNINTLSFPYVLCRLLTTETLTTIRNLFYILLSKETHFVV